MHALWGTVFALGNLFVAYWMLLALLNAKPAFKRKLVIALGRLTHCQTPWVPGDKGKKGDGKEGESGSCGSVHSVVQCALRTFVS